MDGSPRHVLALALVAACGPRYTWPTPPPLVLARPDAPLAVTRCEPAAEPAAPVGHTAPPLAEGALALLDVRGDDRLSIDGPFAVAWSPDGARLDTATPTALLRWNALTGVLAATYPLGAPLESVRQVVASPDGAWAAVVGSARAPGASRDAPVTWIIHATESPSATAFPDVGVALHVTPDGRRLFGDGHSWDLATGAHTATPLPPGETRWLPDGRRALALPTETTAGHTLYVPMVWDAATGRALHRFATVALPGAVALSADGERVAVLHGDLDVFSTRTFARVAHAAVGLLHGLVSLSHDGHRAVVETLTCASFLSSTAATPDCPPPALTLWDLDRAVALAHTAHGAGRGWHFTPDDRYLTGSDTRLVEELLRLPDLTPLAFDTRVRALSPDGRFALHERGPALTVAPLDGTPPRFDFPARVLARSPDGALAAALDADGAMRVEGAGSCLRLGLARGQYGRVAAGVEPFDPTRDQVAFSADGATLYLRSSVDGGTPRFRALDARTGAERWSTTAGPSAAAELSAGSLWVQGRGRPEVLRFDATTGAALGVGRAPRITYATHWAEAYDVRDPAGERVSDLAFPAANRAGTVVASMASLDHTIMFSRWDLAHPERTRDVDVRDLIDRIALSPDERWWAVGLHHGAVRLFPFADASPTRVDAGHHGAITALAFTPAGDRLVSASADGTLALTVAATGRVVGRARFPFDHVTSLWLSADGAELRAETARGLRVRLAVARP